MGTARPPYPPEYRREAVRLVQESGKSRRQIARELNISTETLRQWVKQAELDSGLRHDGLTSDETEEVRQLRREMKVLREEREIRKEPRPSLPRKPSRAGGEVCVRGAREGPSFRDHAVPGPGVGVSPSGYYAWRQREPSARTEADIVLTEHIGQIHQASRGTYGAPRIHAELAEAGIHCGRKRVARLMRTAELVGYDHGAGYRDLHDGPPSLGCGCIDPKDLAHLLLWQPPAPLPSTSFLMRPVADEYTLLTARADVCYFRPAKERTLQTMEEPRCVLLRATIGVRREGSYEDHGDRAHFC